MVVTLLIDLLIVLLLISPQLAVRWALYSARRGRYQSALSAARFNFFPSQGNNRLKALIFCDMDQPSRAKALMRQRAFDPQGKFLLARPELLIYTLANLQQGNDVEAETVMNAVVGSSRRAGAYHFYLAELLLAQCRDLDTAAALITLLRRHWFIRDSLSRRHSVACQISALGAWLLALNGEREEAEEQVETLLRNLPSRSERDAAKIHVLVGEIRLALGDKENARKAFASAIALDPDGTNAELAKSKLADLIEPPLAFAQG